MSNITILECRQNEAQVVNENGDYEVILNNPIVLNEGDQLQVKNIFIDTKQQQAGIIELDNDEQFDFTYTYYIVATGADRINNPTVTFNGNYDGRPMFCIPYLKKVDSSGSGLELIESIRLFGDVSVGPWLGGSITYTWKDINGNDAQDSQFLKRQEFLPPGYIDINISEIAQPGTFNYSLSDASYMNVNESRTVISKTTASFDVLIPYETSLSFLVPKGKYTFNELTDFINRTVNNLITDNQFVMDTNNDPINKNFIKNGALASIQYVIRDILNLDTPLQPPPTLTKDNIKDVVFIDAANGLNGFIIDLDANNSSTFYNVWIGANQFELEYDETYQKFKINIMHTPIYDDKGNMVISYAISQQSTPTITNQLLTAKASYAGIFITGINEFWINYLGFEGDKLTSQFVQQNNTEISIGGDFSGYTYRLSNFGVGVNFTQNYVGSDNLLQKVNTSNQIIFNKVPDFKDYETLLTTSNDFTPIYATNEIIAAVSSGYYLVEIDAKYNNTVLTSTKSYNKISGICSRYYTVGSYTSAGSEGAITYIHNSTQPLMINSLRIRILNPDKTLANDIGDDNAIFIEVINNIIEDINNDDENNNNNKKSN